MKVMTSLLQKKQNFGYKIILTKKKVLSLYLGFKMKTLFRYLLIIVVVFFFLGVLPVIYPPSFFIIIPIAALLFYLGLDVNGCNKDDND